MTTLCTAFGDTTNERASKRSFGGLLASVLQTLSLFFGCAFHWQPLRGNTQHLGLITNAALDF